MSTCRKILLLILFSIFVVCLAIGISACAGGDAGDGNADSGYEDENDDSNDEKNKSSEETTVSVSSVGLNESSLSLEVGETYALIATISPSDATNKSVTWSSSKESVATVSDSGLVTAMSEGTATIIVSSVDGGKTATCDVTVSEAETSIPVTSVGLNESSLSLEVGETYALIATISPSDATNKSVTWSSSDESVATVSDNGIVIAVSEGSAAITVTSVDGGKTATCSITVTYSSKDFIFEEYGNGYALTGYTGTSSVLYVPSEYKGKEVIAIGTMPTDTTLDTLYVSGDGFYENKYIQQVILPESIRTINAGSFAYSSVTEVTIPSSVRAIYSYVFYGCTSLKTVTFNGGTVSAELFTGCDSVENIIVGEEATYSDGVFSSFPNLKTLTVASLNTTARALFTSSDEERQCYTFTISASLGDLYPSSVTSQTAEMNGTSVNFGIPASGCDWYYSSSTIVIEGTTYRYSFEAVTISAWGESSVNGVTYQYPTSVQIKVYLDDEGYDIPSDFTTLTITDQQLSPTSGVLADCPFEIAILNVCPIDYIYVMGKDKIYVDDFDYDDYVLAIVRTDGTIEYAYSIQNYISSEDQELLKTAGEHVVTLSYCGAYYLFAVELDEHVFEGLTFEDAIFAYDGSSKYVYVSGAPDGAEVEYTNNGQTEIGEYVVTALITKQYYTPITLTATLTIVQSSFGITYVLNKDGAANDNPSQYEYGVTLTLNSPTCDYYSFAGWYLDSEFTTEITEIEAGTVGDVVLYAKWISVFIMSGNTITGVTDEVRSYTTLVIPEYVEGVEVKEIAEGALSGCSSLESITLPFVGGSATASSASESTLFGYIFGSSSYSGGTSVTQSYGSGSVTYYIPGNLTEVTITGGQVLYGAFYNCSFLESVILSNDVAGIGDYAFYGCTSLASLAIPESAETIGKYAFYGCESLTAMTVPIGVETIGEYAFANCVSLKNIEMGDGLETIGEYAFSNCSSLTAVSVPSGATRIGMGAFYECVVLASITIPDGVSIVESYVFYGCLSLTAISIPDGVETIGEYAFYSCSNLANLAIGGGVTAIADYAFYGCESLTTVTVPDDVETIGDYAFANCVLLKNITIGASVETIGSYVFANCSSLVCMVIPNSVTSIGSSCFSGCSSLESITIPFVGGAAGADSASSSTLFGYIFGTTSYSGGTSTKQYYRSSSSITYYIPSGLSDVTVSGGQILYGAFYGCSHLKNIIIPDSVTSIGDYAFYDCSSLIHITISEEVTTIGDYAFANCSSLTEIDFKAKNMGNLSSNSLVFENAGENGDGIAVTIGSKVEKIPNYLFQKSNVVSVDFEEESHCASVGAFAFYYCKSLKSIVLPDSVTSIGDSAFYYCNYLSSITIPDTVTSIGSYAFYYCASLKSVTIPSDITSIESHTFDSCISLTSVTIPSNVTSIESGAFNNCSSLVTLAISENVTSFGNDAFNGCNVLTEIYYDAANADDLSEYNGVFGYVGQDSSGITVTIGPNVTYIPSYLFSPYKAFYLSYSPNITAVNFEEGAICEIGMYAFYGCVSLAAVTIPERISSIGDYAFGECVELTAVVVPSGVTSIGNYAFYDCIALMSVTISYGVEIIGDYAFSNCSALEIIAIPDSVESMGTSCLSGCSSLESITLPFVGGSATASSASESTLFGYIFGSSSYSGGTSVTQSYGSGSVTYYIPGNLTDVTIAGGQVLYGAFYNCSFLESVILSNDVAGIGDYAFYGCTSLTSLAIPESAETIGEYAFYGCESLTAMIIPNGVKSLGDSVFYGCTSLNSVTLGSSVEAIGGYMFCNCSSLTSVIIFGDLGTIGEYAFANCVSLKNIEMGDDLESIGEYAFLNCSSLTTVNVPSGVTSIGNSAFSGCSSLESITLPFVGGSATASSASESTLFGYIFGSSSYSGGTSVTQSYGSGSVTYYIPGNLTEVTITGGQVLYGAFYNYSFLESVILSNDVAGIGDYAFYGCTSLASMAIPESAETIGDYAFYSCSSLTYMTIPDSVTSIGEYAFRNCTALTSLAIGKGVTDIGKDAFAACSSLNEIVYNAADVKGLPKDSCVFDGAGENANGLAVTIGTDVKAVPDYLFYESYVTSVIFEDGSQCEDIGNYAFYNCSFLESVILSNDVAGIGDYAFYGCTSLASMAIPESAETIGEYAFYSCSSLTYMTIPDSVTSIGKYAFRNCTALTSLAIGKGVTDIGGDAFAGCSSLNVIVYNAADVKGLSNDSRVFDGAGENADGLAVTIDADVKAVPDYLFYGSYVTSVIFEDGSQCEDIGNYAFYNCSYLTEFTIGSSVKNIGNNAFDRCSSLISLVIPDSVTSIGEYAFRNCTALTSLAIGKGVTDIGGDAFAACSSLNEIVYNAADVKGSSNDSSVFNGAGENANGLAVTIGADVKAVPDYLFCGSYVTSVIFEDGSQCESIGRSAFRNCVHLTGIVIPDSVTSIGEYAFNECFALTSLTIGKGVTSIGKDAFARCYSLNEIFYNAANLDDFSENNRIFEEAGQDSSGIAVTIGVDVKAIPDYLFFEVNIISVIFEDGSQCESIGRSAFQYCRSLTSIVIPSGVTSIGEYAFDECLSLAEIYYNARALTDLPSESEPIFNDTAGRDGDGIAVTIGSDVEIIPDNLFNGAYVKSVVFEEESRCKSIGNVAFHNCRLLTEIIFPDSITSIGESAFGGCSALTSLTIGANVTSIGRSAFENCSSLTEIYYNVADLTNTLTDTDGVFDNAGQEDNGMIVTIGANVEVIPGYLFYHSKVKDIVFEEGSRCTSIGDYAFCNCELLNSVVIPDSVTIIGESTFCNCSALTSVTIGKGVTIMGDYAFRGCSTLIEIHYNAANVGDFTWSSWIFFEAGQNKNGIAVTIGADVERIPNYLFWNVNIKSVDFEDGSICTDIGDYAFQSCNISTISLPSSLTHIGTGAFDGCYSLTAVYFSELETWFEIEFEDKTSNPLSNEASLYVNGVLVTDLIIPDGIETIGDFTFSGCSSLTSITFSESVTSIGDSAFSCCSSLTTVIIPDGVTSIGDSAFSECTSLTSVVLPATLTNMGSWVFSWCRSLTSVTIPEGIERIGEGAFNNCSSLTTVVLPDSVIYIGSDAFSYCRSLTEINIPEGVTRIETSTFEYCDSLKSIIIPNGITYIGSRAFSTCTALTEIVIPDSVTTIDESAFEYCDHLKSIIIPNSVTSIGYGAFKNCSRLTTVYYFGTEDEWVALQDNIGESNSRLTSATIYFYSETEPSESGNYWHYDETTGEVVTW